MPFDCTNWEPHEPRREGDNRSLGSMTWVFAVALVLIVLQICVLVPLAVGSAGHGETGYVKARSAGTCPNAAPCPPAKS
jgi:hypothetical protein